MAQAPDTTGSTPVTTGATSASVDITAAATGAWVYLWCAISTASTTQSGVPSNASWTTLQSTQTAAGTSGACYALYRRKKQAGDTTFSFSWTANAKGEFVWASYTGLDSTTPDEGSAITQNDVTSRSAVPTPSATPTAANRWALAFFGVRTTNTANKAIDWTADAATTERSDVNNSASGSSAWMGSEIADSNGTVTQASHSYTATHNVSGVATSESHDGSAIVFLIPASSASVTGVGAAVTAAGGLGTPSGGANVTGTGAAVTAGAGVGTPSGGASAAGAGAQVSTAGGLGTPSGGASVTGTGAQISVAGGVGSPSGGDIVTGVGSQVSAAGGLGTPSGGANVTGAGAVISAAGGTGSLSGGAAVTGAGARLAVDGGIGSPGTGVNGTGAAITTAAGLGTPSGGASVVGAGAQVTVAAGTGSPAVGGGASVQGVGAVVMLLSGAGTAASFTGFAIDARCSMAFQARVSIAGQAVMSYIAGQPRQAGLVTLASDPWTSMYPDTL